MKLNKIFLISLLGVLYSPALQAKLVISPNSNVDSNVLIDKALQNGEREFVLGKGIHFFSGPIKSDSDNINISGEGVVKVTKNLPLLFDLKGNNIKLSLNIDGQNKLGSAIRLSGNNINIFDSNIRNLNSNNYSSIAIEVNSNGFFDIRNNNISNIYSKPGLKSGNRPGMARAIAIFRRDPNIVPVLSNISNNNISNIMGGEGDAITLWSKGADKYSIINVNVTNNNITNYSRRAIKMQGTKVNVSGNSINNYYNSKYNYNCSSSISVYVAKDIKIENNKVDDNVCSAINVFMKDNSKNISDVGNVVINGNKVNGNKVDFKVGNLKAPRSMLKTGKILFMPKSESTD